MKISCLIFRHHNLCSHENLVKLHEYFNLSPHSRLFPKSGGLSCAAKSAKSDCDGGAKVGTTDCDGAAKVGNTGIIPNCPRQRLR